MVQGRVREGMPLTLYSEKGCGFESRTSQTILKIEICLSKPTIPCLGEMFSLSEHSRLFFYRNQF